MADSTTTPDTEALVRKMVEGLVEHPEDVVIERGSDGSTTTYEITVHDDDTGKVIGRQGRIIRAIRVLARASGTLAGEQVYVDVVG